MKVIKQVLAALLVLGFAATAAAEQPIGNPVELGFAPDRLERITKAFQG